MQATDKRGFICFALLLLHVHYDKGFGGFTTDLSHKDIRWKDGGERQGASAAYVQKHNLNTFRSSQAK